MPYIPRGQTRSDSLAVAMGYQEKRFTQKMSKRFSP
ncbi:Uncharacterised protein [Vibrio cholerae]|nr:Uncharacterised protein [Vibrio cholerae]CSI34173.1 Uncharacterised protein [Vibrio cholerae]